MTPGTVRSRGWKRFALASGALVLAIGAATTAAAFTDFSRLNLGTGAPRSGIGNPHRFDIAVKDNAGVLHDAATPEAAVVLPLAAGTAFSETTPVSFDVTVANRQPGIIGDLGVSLYDPDPVNQDLFGSLLFTVHLDGSATPAIASASADQVNQAGLIFHDVAPGQEHRIRLSAILPSNSGTQVIGKSTQLGVLTNGESK